MECLPHLQKVPNTETEWLAALVALARYLRGPDGCPWDRKQTGSQFAAFVEEEAGELREAFAEDDNAHIEEEWGDTFFTLLATMASAEADARFSLLHALERTHQKMVTRHDHIFGERRAETAEDAARVWNAVKAREKGIDQLG